MHQELNFTEGKLSCIPYPIWANRHMSIRIFTLRNTDHFNDSENWYSV